MNINNPRIHPKTGYYNSQTWAGGPYLVIFNSSKEIEFIVDYYKKYTYKTSYSEILKKCLDDNYHTNNNSSIIFKSLKWVGRTL